MNTRKSIRLLFSIMTVIILQACAQGAQKQPQNADGWTSLFNGKDLTGWSQKAKAEDQDTEFFTVHNGVIVAEAKDKDHDYVWLYSDKEYQDFHLKLKFQGERGDYANSGVQIRSRYDHNDNGGWLNGPQVDIGFIDRNGSIWDETRNNQRWLYEGYNAKTFFFADEPPGWNSLEIIVKDYRIQVIQNGDLLTDYDGSGVLDDANHKALGVGTKGHIALQIHTSDVMKIKFKDIYLRELN